MPKSSIEQIKLDEHKVLNELQKMQRKISIESKKIVDSPDKKYGELLNVLKKVKKIWGYSTVVDDEKFGLSRYLILLKRTNIPVSKEQLDLITTRELKRETSKLGVNIECSFFCSWFF